MNQVKINYSLAKCRGLFILAIPKTHLTTGYKRCEYLSNQQINYNIITYNFKIGRCKIYLIRKLS